MMNFVLIIVIAFIVYKLTWNNLFSWKTIINYLWKNIFKECYSLIKIENDVINNTELRLEESIKLKGEIINSILKYINYLKRENNEDEEEETFEFGYFNFETLLTEIRANNKNIN